MEYDVKLVKILLENGKNEKILNCLKKKYICARIELVGSNRHDTKSMAR